MLPAIATPPPAAPPQQLVPPDLMDRDNRLAMALQMFRQPVPEPPPAAQPEAAAPAAGPKALVTNPNALGATMGNLYHGSLAAPPAGPAESSAGAQPAAPVVQPTAEPAKMFGGMAPAKPPQVLPAADAVADNLHGQPETLSRAQYLAGMPPVHEKTESYTPPPLWKRLLFGASAGLAGLKNPAVTAELVDRYNQGIEQHADQAEQWNRELPTMNQAADDAAYQRYLSGMTARADIAHLEKQTQELGQLTPAQRAELAARTTTTDQGVMQFDPDSQQYRLLGPNKSSLPVISNPNGFYVVDPAKGTVTQLMVDGKPLAPPQAKAQTDLDKFTTDYLAANSLPDTPPNRLAAKTAWQRAGAAPQQTSYADTIGPTRITTENENWGKQAESLAAFTGAIAQATTGSQLANNVLPMMGALMTTSANGVHRINETEVSRFGKSMGSIARQINTALDKAGSGTLPASTVQEMQRLASMYQGVMYRQYLARAAAVANNFKLDPAKTAVTGPDGSNSLMLDQALKQANQPATIRPPGVGADWVQMRAGARMMWVAPAQVDAAKNLGATVVGGGN